MTQYCDQHSGSCANMSNMSKEIDELKREIHEQKGYNSGMFNSANQEIREVNQKLRDEMKDMKKEIQAEIKLQIEDMKSELVTGIDDIKNAINGKDMKKENRFNTFLGNGILPSIILIVGLVAEHFLSK